MVMDRGRAQSVLPPRPVRLNINAEVPTPFVVPWSWYIKQRVYWQIPKLLNVTVSADGDKDSARYGALIHEDKQFGLRISFNQTTALDKYAGYHLVSVSRIGQAQLHYTLSRKTCPCGTRGKACSTCNFSGDAAAAEDAVQDAARAAVPILKNQAPSREAGRQQQPLRVQGACPHIHTRSDPLHQAADERTPSAPAPPAPVQLAGTSSLQPPAQPELGGPMHSVIPSAGALMTAATMARRDDGGGAAGSGITSARPHCAVAGVNAATARQLASGAGGEQVAQLGAADGDERSLERGGDGSRRCGGVRQRSGRSGDGRGRVAGGRRASGSGSRCGAASSGCCSKDDGSGSEDSDGAARSPEPISSNPFRKDNCSCPCHVWRQYWPEPDDPRKHQDEPIAEWDRRRGRSGSREPPRPRKRSRSDDQDWQAGAGGGRKCGTATEAQAERRPVQRKRVATVPTLQRPPAAAAAGRQAMAVAAASGPTDTVPESGRAAAALLGKGAVAAAPSAKAAARPPLPPVTSVAMAAVPPQQQRQRGCSSGGVGPPNGRPHVAQQAAAPVAQKPNKQHHEQCPAAAQAQKPQEELLREQQRQQQQPQRDISPVATATTASGGSNQEPGRGGSGSGTAATAGGSSGSGGLPTQGPPGDHVSVEDAELPCGGFSGDCADQQDSLILQGQTQLQAWQQQTKRGLVRASGGGRGRHPSCSGRGAASLPLSPEESQAQEQCGAAALGITATAQAPLPLPRQQQLRDARRSSIAARITAAAAARARRGADTASPGCATVAGQQQEALQRQILGPSGLGTGAGSRKTAGPQQPGQQQLRPLERNEPSALESGRRMSAPEDGRLAGDAGRSGGVVEAVAGGGVAESGSHDAPEFIRRQAVARQVQHKRPRGKEAEAVKGKEGRPRGDPVPVALAAATANDEGTQEETGGGGGALPAAAGGQARPWAQQQPAGSPQNLRSAPRAALARGVEPMPAAGGGARPWVLAALVVADPPERSICRPGWDVRPLQWSEGSSQLRLQPGALITGCRLSVDPRILQGYIGRGLCFLRLHVERDGFLDGATAAKCVRVEERAGALEFSQLPPHAQGCVFLGWGMLPGGSLVLRVRSASPELAQPAAAAAADAGAVAASLDRRRRRAVDQGRFRSPATAEAAAAAAAAAAMAGGTAPSQPLTGGRVRKVMQLSKLLESAPELPTL